MSGPFVADSRSFDSLVIWFLNIGVRLRSPIGGGKLSGFVFEVFPEWNISWGIGLEVRSEEYHTISLLNDGEENI